MTQDEFNALMDKYLAEYLSGGYFASKYNSEEIEAILDKVQELSKKVEALESTT